jgi:hypothetical protein
MGAKTLELIRDLLPSAQRVSVLANAGDPFAKPFLGQLQPAGETLHLQMQVIMIHAADELAPAFAAMKSSGTDAVVVQPSLPLQRIGDLAIQNFIPAVSPSISFTREGGMASYAAKPAEMYRKAASYVDKILKGSKPGDLPVEMPTKYELAINLKTAKTLGLTIPPSLLARVGQDRRAVWQRLRRPREQTNPYKKSVIEPEPDILEAAEQLKHAQQQQTAKGYGVPVWFSRICFQKFLKLLIIEESSQQMAKSAAPIN